MWPLSEQWAERGNKQQHGDSRCAYHKLCHCGPAGATHIALWPLCIPSCSTSCSVCLSWRWRRRARPSCSTPITTAVGARAAALAATSCSRKASLHPSQATSTSIFWSGARSTLAREHHGFPYEPLLVISMPATLYWLPREAARRRLSRARGAAGSGRMSSASFKSPATSATSIPAPGKRCSGPRVQAACPCPVLK